MRKRKKYLKLRNKQTGKMDLIHRCAASALLGRPLLPGEVVHHLDGDSTNNAPENLLVRSSQRFHAHIEHVLRQERRGQVHLFPETLQSVRQRPRGTLFENIAVE